MWFISNIFDRVVDLPWYRKDHLLTRTEWEEIKTIYRHILRFSVPIIQFKTTLDMLMEVSITMYWGDYIEHPVNYYYREDNHPSVIMYCCSKIYFLNDSCEEEYICEESIGNPYMQ